MKLIEPKEPKRVRTLRQDDARFDAPDIASRPPHRLLRLPEVRSRVGLSRSTIWRRIRAREFPRPVKISTHAVAWRETDISDWISGRQET